MSLLLGSYAGLIHSCFVFVLFCFIFSVLLQRDDHARRKVWPFCCRLCHLAPRLSTFLFDIEAFDQFWEVAESPEATGRSEFPWSIHGIVSPGDHLRKNHDLTDQTLLVPSCTYWPVEYYWISRKDSDPNSANPWCSLNVESCFSTPKTSIFWGSGHGICAKGHDVSSFHWNVHSLSEAHPMYFHIFSLYFPTDGIQHAQTRWLRNPMILEAWIPRKCVLWSGHHTRPLQSQLPSQRLVNSLGCNSKTLSSSWTHWA